MSDETKKALAISDALDLLDEAVKRTEENCVTFQDFIDKAQKEQGRMEDQAQDLRDQLDALKETLKA